MKSTNGNVLSLGSGGDAPPPPPSASLMAALKGMKPVRTRVPARSAAILGVVLAAIPVGTLVGFGHRPDLGALPVWWIAATTLVWIAGITLALVSATLPPRGDVLPDTAKALRGSALVAAILMAMGLFATVDAPGATIFAEPTFAGFVEAWRRCTIFALIATVPALVAGGILLRRLFPIGSRWAAAAVGAAGGAAAGLALHLLCPIGGGLHAGFAHGGGVLLGAVLGGLVLPRPLRS